MSMPIRQAPGGHDGPLITGYLPGRDPSLKVNTVRIGRQAAGPSGAQSSRSKTDSRSGERPMSLNVDDHRVHLPTSPQMSEGVDVAEGDSEGLSRVPSQTRM